MRRAPLPPVHSPERAFRSPGARPWAVLAAAGSLAFGVATDLDRSHSREAPRWEPSHFVPIATSTDPCTEEGWTVAVHANCRRCRRSLARLVVERARHSAPIWVRALVVEERQPPAGSVFAELGADEVWWDSRQMWRRRWGGGDHGEIWIFDRHGHHVRTLAAASAQVDSLLKRLGRPRAAGGNAPGHSLGVPPDDF